MVPKRLPFAFASAMSLHTDGALMGARFLFRWAIAAARGTWTPRCLCAFLDRGSVVHVARHGCRRRPRKPSHGYHVFALEPQMLARLLDASHQRLIDGVNRPPKLLITAYEQPTQWHGFPSLNAHTHDSLQSACLRKESRSFQVFRSAHSSSSQSDCKPLRHATRKTPPHSQPADRVYLTRVRAPAPRRATSRQARQVRRPPVPSTGLRPRKRTRSSARRRGRCS